MPLLTIPTKNFDKGTVDTLEPESIPRGAASRSINWISLGDRIELRRGFRFLGTDSVQTGSGRCSGLRKVTSALGVEWLYYTYGTKLKYFNRSTSEWVEVGSDLLGSDADDEDISLEEYVTNAGHQLWVNSPNLAGLFKVMIGNRTAYRDVYSSAKNYKGHIKIDTNSMYLWGRPKDKTGIYRSYVDSQSYTTVSNEVLGSGDGVTKAFSGVSLTALSTSPRTCFAIEISSAVVAGGDETFADNFDGTLTSDLGGTGTINYVTGAWSVTFFSAPTNASNNITADYQWENSNSGGVSDFTFSGTRLAGEGIIFRQDEGGGAVQNIASYDNVYYCFHIKKTWALTIALDDSADGMSNVPYRANVGIPNLRAFVETGEGIYYVDDVTGEDKKIRLLTYEVTGSQKVVPVEQSQNKDLNDLLFDQCAAIEFGDFVLFACRTSNSSINNRTVIVNRKWKAWDLLDYAASVFEVYDGVLHGGDAYTDNVMELFSGFDDDGAEVTNYWEGNLDDHDIEGLKKTKQFRVRGLIAPEQKLKISLAFNDGAFGEVGVDSTHEYAIEGDQYTGGQAVSIGGQTLGSGEIGGGSDGVTAHQYERLFKIRTDKYERVKVRFEAIGIGYISVSLYEPWDVRYQGKKTPRQYRG